MKKSIDSQLTGKHLHSEYEKYLESIVDTIREALIVLDKDLKVISANKTFYERFKVSPKQTEKVLIYKLGNGQWNIPELKNLLEEILPSHNPFNNFRAEHNFPHIGKKVMLLNARQIKAQGQWKDRILLAIEDITKYDRDRIEKEAGIEREKEINRELLQNQKDLLDGERRFRALAENIPILCWMAKPDGYIYWYNSRWYEYTGTKPKQMEGWGWQSVHDPNVLPEVLKKWKKAISDGSPFEMTFPLKGADNKFRPFLTRIVPVYDDNGKVIHWFGTNTDISGQLKAEETMLRLAAIVESSDDAIVSKNLDGIITSWNKGAEKIFGYKAKEIVGKSIRTIIPKDLQHEEDKILSQLRKGKKIEHFQTVRIAKDGRKIDVSITVSPMKDKTGKIIGASKIARNITNEKNLERQKDNFLGIASHELKTPVTSIKAYGQVLQAIFKRKGDTYAVTALQKMDAQINKLTLLISDLLDVTKIQAGKLLMQNIDYDFNGLVNELIDELQLTTERHTLIKQLDKPIQLHGDKERTGQVITNLISNAIKYSPHTDKIIIKTKNSNNAVTLSVKDFGVGIPKEKQKKVFEQFFRVSGEKQHTFPGLGLGLFISSEIVKRQGGRIWVESTEGKGSTFCFTLPFKSKQENKGKKSTIDEEAIKHE